MKTVSAEQYLKYAVENAKNYVANCVNVGLRKQAEDFYIRAIFPCSIYVNGSRGQKLYDLPYLKYCSFSYVVCEIRLEVEKPEIALKIGKNLRNSQEFQTEVGKVILKELLPTLYGRSFIPLTKALETVIIRYGNIKKKEVDVDSIYRTQAVEFSFSTERITQLTAGGIEYILPSKPLLRKISSKLHKLYLQKFFNPGSVHDEYMRLNQRDKKFEFHRPRGWMENNMTPFYCGLKELSKEKLDFQPRWEKTDCPVSLAEVEEILSFAPQTVSIPLFSFSIFSIIKFFFTKYPSRISMKDSYQSVTRSLRKILFLSLEGKNKTVAQQIAELYCGTFLRHSLGGTPASDNESKYVHDGIVIYSENVKRHLRISERNIDSYLVKDACALFVCIQLPMNAKPIRIKFEGTMDKIFEERLKNCRDKLDLVLQNFIAWLEACCENNIRDFSEIENYDNFVRKMSIEAEYSMWKDSVSRTMRRTFTKIFEKFNTLLLRCSDDPTRKEKFSYLLASFLIFTLYLSESYEEGNSKRIGELRNDGLDALYNLYGESTSIGDIVKTFSQYISHLLITKAIILLWGELSDTVLGWFDPKRNAVFLRYSEYYENFLDFCRKNNFYAPKMSKGDFQSNVLAKWGFVQLRQNGKGSGYFRADRRIQVNPVSIEDTPKENVIEISLKPFEKLAPLSPEALEVISTLKKQKLRRRAQSKKAIG